MPAGIGTNYRVREERGHVQRLPDAGSQVAAQVSVMAGPRVPSSVVKHDQRVGAFERARISAEVLAASHEAGDGGAVLAELVTDDSSRSSPHRASSTMAHRLPRPTVGVWRSSCSA
jgi:hypothetical protein